MEYFKLNCEQHNLLLESELLSIDNTDWKANNISFSEFIENLYQHKKILLEFYNYKFLKNFKNFIVLLKSDKSERIYIKDGLNQKMIGSTTIDKLRVDLLDCLNQSHKTIIEYKIQKIVGKKYNIPIGLIIILAISFLLNIIQSIVLTILSK